MDIFLDRLLPLIEATGKSDKELERDLNLPKDAIYNWRRRVTHSYQNPKYIERFAEYFHVSAAYLMCLTDDPKPIKKAATMKGDGMTDAQAELFLLLPALTDFEVSVLLATAKSLIEGRTHKKHSE